MSASEEKKQKVNVTAAFQFAVQNPYLDVKVMVMQNGRDDLFQWAGRPSFIRQNQLVYNDFTRLNFNGGNEFRRFDTRTFRFRSERIAAIANDTLFAITLLPDRNISSDRYMLNYDENGGFFIRNLDGRNPATDADYSSVTFTLSADAPDNSGAPYVIGKFNDYRLNDQSRMVPDASGKRYRNTQLLKQGIYDYQYVWGTKDGKPIYDTAFNGSFFETNNTYQVFVYYRKPGGRWDELAGYTEVSFNGILRR